MKRRRVWLRWMVLLGSSAAVPAFILNCDKAALNYQRGLLNGLGEVTAELLLSQVPDGGEIG